MLALIRGAGDIASGAAMRLWRCGIDVVMTDLARPTAIRRTVAFSNAIVHGETTVEGLRAVRAENAAEAKKLLREGSLPVLADPECACREELAPDALVDAILAKRNLGTKIDDAPIVVGVGPDESSLNAIRFAVREAVTDGEQLDLVSGWGLPAILTKPAEAMGGGLDPVGEQYQRNLEQLAAELKADNEELDVVAHAVEGSSPTHAILNYAKDSKLLVLGTHSRSTLGRTLFGSVTHSVLLNLCVPTVIVPQK